MCASALLGLNVVVLVCSGFDMHTNNGQLKRLANNDHDLIMGVGHDLFLGVTMKTMMATLLTDSVLLLMMTVKPKSMIGMEVRTRIVPGFDVCR